MTSEQYRYVGDLAAELEPPADGIVSKTIVQDDRLKAVVFAFAPGQEMTEHAAGIPAVMHFLKGTATVGVAGETFEVGDGGWFHMDAGVPHSIVAKTAVSMLLLLLKGPKQGAPAAGGR